MTLHRICDHCHQAEADVGWDDEAVCLPCFLADIGARSLAARAAIARQRRGHR